VSRQLHDPVALILGMPPPTVRTGQGAKLEPEPDVDVLEGTENLPLLGSDTRHLL
jgi:hypothetical protein